MYMLGIIINNSYQAVAVLNSVLLLSPSYVETKEQGLNSTYMYLLRERMFL